MTDMQLISVNTIRRGNTDTVLVKVTGFWHGERRTWRLSMTDAEMEVMDFRDLVLERVRAQVNGYRTDRPSP